MGIVGIDEVGRGAWAGPLVVGAVLLKANGHIPGLNDSKILTKSKRTFLTGIINEQAIATGLGFVSAGEVDELGLTAATTLACERALELIRAPYDEIIIDGSINYLPNELRAKAIIKADALVPAVCAASIVAKVARDAYMQELSKKFPDFNFDMHVGYGTAAHIEALEKYGITSSHRMSFKPIRALVV